MKEKIIDRLFDRVEEVGVVCVGLDTHLDYVPASVRDKHSIEESLFLFNKEIIDATEDLTAIYKLQIAYYEAFGIEGLKAYVRTTEYLRNKSLLTIGDVKRGDIAATAKMYAKAHFTGEFEVDFITLSPYMGYDSITPYMEYIESGDKGAFVLLRTSNPGAKDIEYLEYNKRPLYYEVGDHIAKIGEASIGRSGYSALGMVVGGTHSEEAVEIREQYKNSFFLIPGYGAQGASADDIRKYLNDFNGGIVNSSRGIITHYKKYQDGEHKVGEYARLAVESMRNEICVI